jgi:hypothetical protein
MVEKWWAINFFFFRWRLTLKTKALSKLFIGLGFGVD